MQIQGTRRQAKPCKCQGGALQPRQEEQQHQEPKDSWARGLSAAAGGVALGGTSFLVGGRIAAEIARSINPPTNPLDFTDLFWALGVGIAAGIAGTAGGAVLGGAIYDNVAQ